MRQIRRQWCGVSEGLRRGGVRGSGVVVGMVAWTLVCVCLLVGGVQGKTTSKEIITYENWVYLDKFAFDTTGEGKIMWSLLVNSNVEGLSGQESSTTTCSSCELYFEDVLIVNGCEHLQ